MHHLAKDPRPGRGRLFQLAYRGLLAFAEASMVFLNTLDSVARVRAMVEFDVNDHNTKMPQPAFSGQTPDEMFFGTGAKVPEELSRAKGHARAARMAANRAMSCERCLGQRASLPGEQIPH